MHNFAKKIMECVKAKTEAKGLDNFDDAELCRLEKWVCIADKIAEYDYYYHITEAMEKPENEYGVNYDENGKYYTPMRNAKGQYMSRGYSPDMRGDIEHYRDMDHGIGKMYYTDMSNMGSWNGHSESGYERAKRGYEEFKDMNMGSENMMELKEMFTELKKDMKEMKPKMTPNELSYSRTELSNLANTMM